MLRSENHESGAGEGSCPDCGTKFVFSPDTVAYQTLNAGGEGLRLLTLRCKKCPWEGAWRVDENGDLLVREPGDARRNITRASDNSLDLKLELMRRAFRTVKQAKQIESLQIQVRNLEKAVVKDASSKVQALGRKKQNFSRFFEEANLTDKQREVASLVWEYGLPVVEVAKRLGKHHSTIQYLKARADQKMEFRDRNRVKSKPREV